MENAAEALKMAAFTLLFVGALTIAMITLSQARTVSQVILDAQDETKYYSYIDETEYINGTEFKTERTVKFDEIVPVLYRYYKENYRVEFYKADGTELYIYINNKGNRTNALDIDDEMNNNESWRGSPQATKEHLDKILTRNT